MVACKSSGKITTSTLFAPRMLVTNLLVNTDGSNAATVKILDGGATGREILNMTVVGASYYGGMTFTNPLICENGAYVAISGTGASAFLYYQDTSVI